MPRLNEVYYFCFGKEPSNQHDARFDVLALVEVITGIQLSLNP